jgi:hypothetical protein
MTYSLRQTVNDKIVEINSTSYPTLLALTKHLNENALGELLDLLRELEARAERAPRKHR